MITQLLITVCLGLVTGILGLAPAYSLPDSITGFGASLGGAIASVDGVFPVVTLGICLGVVLGLQLFLFAWSGIVMFYKLIPFKAT